MADGATIAEQIADIAASKAAIAAAIAAKGVVVPEGTKLSGLAEKVEAIETGGTSGEGYAHFWEDPQFVNRAAVTAAHDFVPTELPAFLSEDNDDRCVPAGLFAYDAGLKSVDLTKVERAEGATVFVEAYAFYNCKNLESVKFVENRSVIYSFAGPSSFEGCSSLKTIEWPTEQFFFSPYAFASCGIEALDFSQHVVDTSVYFESQGVFSSCTNLKSFRIGRCLSFPPEFFYLCGSLETVVVEDARTPGSVSIGSTWFSIYSRAFAGCSSLKEFNLSMNLEGLTYSWYSSVGVLFCNRTYSRPDSSTFSQYRGAFSGCTSLVTFSVPALCYSDSSGLEPRDGIESVVIPSETFSSCSSLQTFSAPLCEGCPDVWKMTLVGKDAFSNCDALQTVSIPSFYKQADRDVPDIVVGSISLGEGAFQGLPELTTVTLTDQLTEISKNAFTSCKKLQSFTIEDSGMSPYLDDAKLDIGDSAFRGCEALTTFSIPESRAVTKVGLGAFFETGALQSIRFAENVEIGENAFLTSGLTALTIPTGAKIGANAFAQLSSCTSIHVASGVVSIGETAFQLLNPACSVVFEMTKAEVQAMANYPFGFDLVNDPERKDFILHCTDGDIAVPQLFDGGETTQEGGAE